MASKRKARPTIAAVAKSARVAQSTVSRVLNGGYVSDKTRERVERAIERLGYFPSVAAKNFASGRAGAVGLVVEDIASDWLTGILKGLERELRPRSTALLICSTGSGKEFDSGLVAQWITERRVDGLIFVRPRERETELVAAAHDKGVALAVLAPDKDFGVGKVLKCQNLEAGRDVGRHLTGRGHRHVAFVGGPKDSVDSLDRCRGLREGLSEAGVCLMSRDVRFAQYTSASGRTYARAWLRLARRPTAVVLGNDAMALGFMHDVMEAGVRVPADVSVVGFDDIASAAVMWPGLTTARQEASKLAEAAFRSVIRQIEAPEYEHFEAIEFAMPLIVRQSTARVG